MTIRGHTTEFTAQPASVSSSAGRAAAHVTADGDVRIGPVAAVPMVLTELGVNPRRAFLRAGVPLQMFRNPENRIAFEALGRLLSECASLTNCGHFGLLVGRHFDLKGLGAIGYLMRNSATVGEALRALLLHLHLHDRGAAPVLLNLDATTVILGYSIYQSRLPGVAQLYDAAIAIGFRALVDICGPAWRPLRVQLSYVRPKDTRPYRKFFGSNLRFDAEVSGIVFASSWLDQAIEGADPALRNLIATAIRQSHANSAMTFADEVRSALHQMVLNGISSSEDVAGLFGIHERTLRKRLAVENTCLQQLVNQTRFTLAQQLLANTQLPLSEIAAALHYADSAVFSRAFRKWAQVSPKEWRARQ
jgi:AraC-like DNA-binding protein